MNYSSSLKGIGSIVVVLGVILVIFAGVFYLKQHQAKQLYPTSTAQTQKTFPVWKTIKLGTGLKSADDFRKALKNGNFHFTNIVNIMFDSPAFTVASTETEVELIKITVADLGFSNGANTRDIYKRAQELGLELCPPEVGPQLRLQYKDQPADELLHIAMEPMERYLYVFDVEQSGWWHNSVNPLWLSAGSAYPDGEWLAHYLFVFCLYSS